MFKIWSTPAFPPVCCMALIAFALKLLMKRSLVQVKILFIYLFTYIIKYTMSVTAAISDLKKSRKKEKR